MQINRLFEITYYLLGKGKATAQELADHIGVSKRTIFRDLDVLSVSGIPIYTEKGNGGGVKLMDEFVFDKSLLSEREQREILSALQNLSTVKTEETELIIEKLSAMFKKDSSNWFQVDFSSWGNGDGGSHFPKIKTAIFDKRIVEFDYYSSYGKKTKRRVEPLQLWFKSHSWYFKGYCLSKNDVRLFKLTRIQNLIITDEHFEPRDLSKEPAEQMESLANEPIENRICKVKLVMKISPEMAYRVYDDFQESNLVYNQDGSITGTMFEPEDNGLYGYILSYGEYAEVLEPEHIRKIISEKALRISARNKT